MGKVKDWFINHKPSKRRLIQLYTALLVNCNVKGFFTGTISEAPTKGLCVPGMNCYSCPGAIGACPMGTLQNSYAKSNKSMLFYVLGIIGLFGIMLGRFLCGYLCPFGFIQDLLYMIKTPKIRKGKVTRILSYLKYIMFGFLAVVAPIIAAIVVHETQPVFCKLICPVGTFEGSIYIVFHPNNADLIPGLTGTFAIKLVVAIIVIGLCIFIARPFCRFLCPMGAVLSLFNGISVFGVHVNSDKCVSCGKCITTCKYDIKHPGDRECISCGECIKGCPTNAIYYKQIKDFIKATKKQELAVSAPTNVVPSETKEIIEVEPKTSEIAENKVEEVKQEPNKKPVNKKKVATIVTASAMVAVLAGAAVYFNVFAKGNNKGKIIAIGEEMRSCSLYSFKNPNKPFNAMDYKGTPMVINFWSTTCSGCVAELPEFEEVAKQYTNVKFVAVDISDDQATALEYMKQRDWDKWTIEFLYDNINEPLYRAFTYGSTMPITAFIDKDFKLVNFKNGSIMKTDLIKYVTDLGGVAEPTPNSAYTIY